MSLFDPHAEYSQRLTARQSDVSTITDDQIAGLVTYTVDEIRKIDLPN